MAVSKILNMKESGISFAGRHLKVAIDYIKKPWKTQGGRLTGCINCQPDYEYEQMEATKKMFGKSGKRQAYHIIISFKEDETDADTAFEITRQFAESYLGDRYETVFAVHDNTAHIHGHVIWNSVSFVDGRKYRYENGDWAKYIQPQVNELCEEHELSVLDISSTTDKKEREWDDYKNGKFVWSRMIRRDFDACILQADSYETFLDLLRDKGYAIKQGKYLSVRAPGMPRNRRSHKLGDNYTIEAIKERIVTENLNTYVRTTSRSPKILYCKMKRVKRAKLSGLQKKYFAKLYRLGKLKKKPYSQAWKYKDDIRKMHELQKQYLFLSKNNITDFSQLKYTYDVLEERRKEAVRRKNRIYYKRRKFKDIFDIADEMADIKNAEEFYLEGDTTFEDEHREWNKLSAKLKEQGYTFEEVMELKEHFKNEISEAMEDTKKITANAKLAVKIIEQIINENKNNYKQKGESRTTEKEKEIQPKR